MTALQQKRLMALAVRTMALPCGRAAFTLGEPQQFFGQACQDHSRNLLACHWLSAWFYKSACCFGSLTATRSSHYYLN
jgi:hypothetical protein